MDQLGDMRRGAFFFEERSGFIEDVVERVEERGRFLFSFPARKDRLDRLADRLDVGAIHGPCGAKVSWPLPLSHWPPPRSIWYSRSDTSLATQ